MSAQRLCDRCGETAQSHDLPGEWCAIDMPDPYISNNPTRWELCRACVYAVIDLLKAPPPKKANQ